MQFTMTNIVSQNLNQLIDSWLEAESNGVKFPVPFDTAWQIAGYSRKDSAKRYLPKAGLGEVFHVSVEKPSSRGGRPKETITLSCDGLKHLCLMANTEEGMAIRQYFIEAEKKWRLVEKVHPEVAQDIEVLRLKIELTRLEAQKAQTELSLIQFRHSVVTICPEPVQQKVLGYQTVKEIEYRDRIIKDDDIVNDGSTVTKTELCKRYGLLTRNGKPDYKLLNHYLESSGLIHNPDAWQTSAYIQENEQLKREYVKVLDSYYQDCPRNKYIVE